MLNTVNKLCLFVSFIIQNAIIKRPTIFNWLGIKFLLLKTKIKVKQSKVTSYKQIINIEHDEGCLPSNSHMVTRKI